MRNFFIIIVLLLLPCQWAAGQPMSEEYYRENPSWLDAELWASDGDYYTLRGDGYSPYEEFGIYGFSFVDYSFRGEATLSLTSRLGQMELQSPLERYSDYALLSLLRRTPSVRHYHYSTSLRGHATDIRTESIETSPLVVEECSALRLQLSSRSYRLGVGYKLSHRLSDSVAYSLAVGGRWGDDSAVRGLFCNEEYVWLSGEWQQRVREGLHSSLQVAFMIAPQERSQRSWNSQEVFSLAGTTTYNSYWGYQNGRVRSARIRREAVPTLYASWNLDDNYILSNINISTLVRAGRKSRTSLEWNNAPNPTPDYWGYLPSGQYDPEVALMAESVWHQRDEQYTQIGWHSLYAVNRLSTSGAKYLLMDERRDLFSASVDASAALLGMRGGRVGFRGGVHRSHNYNTPADMLGSESVAEGFNIYDYRLGHTSWEFYAWLYGDYSVGQLFAAVDFGGEGVGYNSDMTALERGMDHFTTVSLKGGWGRNFGPRVRVGATGRYNSSAPFVEDLYGATEGRVTLNPYATNQGCVGGDVWCDATLGPLRLNFSLFASYQHNRSAVENMWHDPSDQYSALLAGGLNTLNMGAELSARVGFDNSLSLEGHLALGRYRYTSNGVATLVNYDTGSTIIAASELQLRGLTSSSSPQLLSALVVKYFTPRGWLLGMEGVVAADRVVEPSLLLSSDHLHTMAHTPEEQEALGDQQSLGTATSVNVFIFRRFADHWSFSLSVRNLLSSTEAYRGGYQPSRVVLREQDNIQTIWPHAARYQHIYPRHAYLTINYEF